METHQDMSFSLSATLLITAQNCNASIEHQAVIYPGVYSTHKSEEFEIVMDRFGWELTEIWWKLIQYNGWVLLIMINKHYNTVTWSHDEPVKTRIKGTGFARVQNQLPLPLPFSYPCQNPEGLLYPCPSLHPTSVSGLSDKSVWVWDMYHDQNWVSTPSLDN